MIASARGDRGLRLARLLIAQSCVLLNIFLQVYLLAMTKKYVTAKRVQDARQYYGTFQHHMYANHTSLTSNGFDRGIDGYFQPELFDSLDEGVKDNVCQIPPARPCFFIAIILIWTLTCAGEIGDCIAMVRALVFSTPTIDSMTQSIVG